MKLKQIRDLSKKIAAAALAFSLAFSGMAISDATVVVKAEEETGSGTGLADSGLDYDYARALQYSMYFYDANMCGTGVSANTKLSWRGDCHTYDAEVPLQPMDQKEIGTNLSQEFIDKYKDVLDPDGDGCVDVAGGFHDAGDHVKFGMPENYSAATLGWGYYEFRDSYTSLGQQEHIETLLRYFNDYLMKCTFRDADGEVVAHCYQVGDGDIDHAYWESPEVDSMARPAYFLTAEKPQTDYVVSAAASLAINYLNFMDTDPEYAEKSLDYAKALWDFANSHDKELSDNGDGPKQYYGSSKWEDDYCWAGAWLYKATGDETYLDQLLPFVDYYAPSGWAYCWNDMWSGALTLLAQIDQENPELDLQNKYREVQGKTQYEDADFWKQIEKAIDTWMTHYTTKGGYAFLNQWGSARYNTAMQFITLIYEKYHPSEELSAGAKWAESQMKYIMGNNPLNRSYIVGYNDKSVKYPHHRAASGLISAEDPREQKHVLYGALAGGPDGLDKHNDTTNDYIYNEVTIDYNAAFVGACAGLYHFFGTDDMAVTENFPPVEEASGEEAGGNKYWVEAFAVDDLHDDGAGVTKISLKVMTNATDARKDISVRYYFNSEEIANVDGVKVSELYDQASAEEEGADGVISGPFKYDKLDNVYYYEITWDGYPIANSGKKYQCLAGMYYGDNWDPTNDYSYQELPVLTDSDMFANGKEVETPYICVYSSGELVGGIEPDGTTASEAPAETPSTTTKAPSTTTKKNPVTTQSQPDTTEDGSDETTTTKAPVNTTTQKPVTTKKPSATTQDEQNVTEDNEEPSSTTKIPSSSTEKPPVSTTTQKQNDDSEEGEDTEKPNASTTTKKPSTTTSKPVSTTQHKPNTTEKPGNVTTTRIPSVTTSKPTVSTTQNKPNTTEKPGNVTTTRIPSATTSKPVSTTQDKPNTTEKPGNTTTTRIPSATTSKPANSTTQSRSDSTELTDDSSTQNDSSTTTQNVPEQTTQKPSDTTDNSAVVPTTQKDASGTTQNSSGVMNPVTDNTLIYGPDNWQQALENMSAPAKVTSLKCKKSGRNVQLKWKAQSNITGYKVYYSFSSKGKYKLCKTTKNNSVVIKKLKKNKKYYFKIRSYRKNEIVGNLYGKYSKIVKVNVR